MYPSVHCSTIDNSQNMESNLNVLSMDRWINKMWYIYTMGYYSAIKRNEIGSFIVMWMDLEFVIRSEVNQKEENKYWILMHMYEI